MITAKKGDKSASALEKEQIAWQRRVEGASQTKIAMELGISIAAVNTMLGRLMERNRKQLDEDIRSHNELHVAQLENIFFQSYHAWQNDRKPSGARDTAYLNTAMEAVKTIRKIVISKKYDEDAATNPAGKEPLARIMEILNREREKGDIEAFI